MGLGARARHDGHRADEAGEENPAEHQRLKYHGDPGLSRNAWSRRGACVRQVNARGPGAPQRPGPGGSGQVATGGGGRRAPSTAAANPATRSVRSRRILSSRSPPASSKTSRAPDT